MSTPRFEIPRPGKSTALAAVFLDYENLHQLLSKHQKGGPHPDELILEMIDELRRTLQTDYQTEASILLAYADFGNLRGDGLYIQQSLYLHGVSPRFVASSFNKEAAEIQLSSDLTDLIHTRLDITTYVLVSGDRMHLPLIQKLKQYGRTALLVPLTHPPLAERTQVLQEALQIGGFDLLSESSRRCLYDLNSVSSNGNAAPPPRATPAAPRNVVHHEVTDDIAYETLRVIEEFFGQYDEVYLTPLLRKLSEVLNEDNPTRSRSSTSSKRPGPSGSKNAAAIPTTTRSCWSTAITPTYTRSSLNSESAPRQNPPSGTSSTPNPISGPTTRVRTRMKAPSMKKMPFRTPTAT